MTHLPPTPPTLSPDYASPNAPALRRPWAISELICSVVLILLVSFTAYRAAAEQAAPAVRESTVDMALVITSRMSVGIHNLLHGGALSDAPLLKRLDDLAKTPRDQFHAAIVHGEMHTPAEALTRADSLAEHNPHLAEDTATLRAIYDSHSKPPLEQWQAFHDRNAFFADLALATAKPAGDPERDHVITSAIISLIVIELLAVVGFAALVAGMVLLILGIVFLASRRIVPAFPSSTFQLTDGRTYLQGFTFYIALMALLGILLRNVLHLPLQYAEGIGLPIAFLVGALWPLLNGQTRRQWRAALGAHKGKGVIREMFSGILGYIAGLPIMALGFLATLLLVRITGSSPTHPINDVLQRGPAWIALAFALASIWAPITEELMFRGAFFANLRERYSWWLAAPLVAIVFALIHPQGWVAAPALAGIAIVLAGIREWRGSIIGSITAHCMHNTITLAVVLLLLG